MRVSDNDAIFQNETRAMARTIFPRPGLYFVPLTSYFNVWWIVNDIHVLTWLLKIFSPTVIEDLYRAIIKDLLYLRSVIIERHFWN